MKRILYGLMILIMAVAAVLPAASPAMADDDNGHRPQAQATASLMIKAPNVIEVSQPLTITVVSKRGNETIAGASVYALKSSDLVVTADSENYTTLMSQFTATAEAKGLQIGTTGTDGKVSGSLSESGRFILVAIKDGYQPGFTRISVTTAPEKALNIKVTGSVETNKSATITVTERFMQKPVAGASVYGRLITDNFTLHVSASPSAPSLQATAKAEGRGHSQIVATAKAVGFKQSVTARAQAAKPFLPINADNVTVIRPDPWDEANAETYAAEIKSGGFLLGTTDSNGQLSYTFTAAGTYVLAAIEDGYIPGFARTNVRTPSQGKLQIKSPDSASVAAPVTLVITDKGTGQPVAGVSLWALGIGDIKGTAESVWGDLVSGSAVSDVTEKYKGWAKDKGIMIGTSSDSGEVTYAFANSGRYLLAAIKDNYAPGFSQIKIGAVAQKQLVVTAPQSAPAGQQITVSVTEKDTGQPVDNATVFAFSGDKIKIHPNLFPAPRPVENGTATQILPDASASGAVSSKEAGSLLVQSQVQPLTLGTTDANGQVTYTFTDAGIYTLVAFKEGNAAYLAGGTRISITSTQSAKGLKISATINSAGGQPSVITVTDTSSGDPVQGATVYVLKANEIINTKPNSSGTWGWKPGEETARAQQQGAVAGSTDANGQLSYTFTSSGQFILAAFKDGYTAGFTYATVGASDTQKPLPFRGPPTSNNVH